MLNPILSKLQKLYSSLDELKSSGEDVVRDIKKEINNLELEYLKDTVFPNISKQLGKELANLRCQLDMSFQYDGDKNIDSSFCTSNSGMLFRDKYTVTDTSDYSDIDEAPLYASEDTTLITSPTPDEDNTYEPILYLEEYSERSIVVYGDTKPYSDTFKARGGYFNPMLKVGPGWIFSKRREQELRSIIKFADNKRKDELSLFEPISESRTGNIIPSIKSVDYYINAFDRMKNVTVRKITGPHKAIFLLTTFEAIRIGIIKDEKVYLNSKLLSLHDKLWKQYVPSKAPFLCNICQPFIHLASEDFFKLDLKCEITNINKNWTVSGVKSVCNYGILDKELFLLAQDSNHRKTLAMHLISRYCAPLRDISAQSQTSV
jgi:hypothetical protein